MVNKLTNTVKPLDEVDKINEIIDALDNIDVPIRNIGEIVISTTPLTDAGLHLLDGALIDGSGSYSAFVTHIAGLVSTYPDLFTTESAWQTAVTNNGICDKYVYDNINNTVRLPKWGIQAYTKPSSVSISTATTVPVIGNGLTLGLTDGTVNAGMYQADYLHTYTGAYGTNVGSTGTPGSIIPRPHTIGVTTDSTKSGLVAQTANLSTVSLTQYPLNCYYYIVLATSTKTDIQVDIDEIVTDLNGKADVDLTNLSNTQSSNFDGQWVYSSLTVANSVAVSSNNVAYSLSSYLPNDGYNYEVLLSCICYTDATSGHFSRIALTSDLIVNYINIAQVRTRTASTVDAAGNCIIPVGAERIITFVGSTSASFGGTYTIVARGYRRIGTNQ